MFDSLKMWIQLKKSNCLMRLVRSLTHCRNWQGGLMVWECEWTVSWVIENQLLEQSFHTHVAHTTQWHALLLEFLMSTISNETSESIHKTACGISQNTPSPNFSWVIEGISISIEFQSVGIRSIPPYLPNLFHACTTQWFWSFHAKCEANEYKDKQLWLDAWDPY